MVIRKSDRVSFPTSVRAVCLEMEVEVAHTSVDDSIRKLIKIAEDAGWEVRVAGKSKLKWYDADGKLVTATPTKAVGHTIDNIRNTLRKGGLEIPDDRHPKPKAPQAEEPSYDVELEEDVITPEAALEVLIDYVDKAGSIAPARLAELEEEVASLKADRARLSNEVQNLQTQVLRQTATLQQVSDAFDLPSWEVLPTIAGVMGVTTRSRT